LLLLYKNIQTIRTNEDLVDHSSQVKLALQSILQSTTDAETDIRGYLLSGDSQFLTSYASSRSTIQKQLLIISRVTADNPQQQKLIQQVKEEIAQRFAMLQSEIKLQQQGDDSDQAAALVEHGRLVMSEVRKTISTMMQNEDVLLSSRSTQTTESYQILYIASLTGVVFTLGLLILAFYLIRTEFRRRNMLEQNKDEFLSMASHELKTPITSLKLFTEVLDRKLRENKINEAKQVVKKIVNQSEKLSALITDLLDITRIQTGKLQMEKAPFDLNELIDDTVEALQETTRRHKIRVRGKIRQLVSGDRYRIYQVLSNLLTNAIKYSPNGGTIVIRVSKQQSHALVSVVDKGVGIEKKHQKKIFERLYQIGNRQDRSSRGLGIGLFVSAQIVKQHHGRIWVKSKKGKGSIFSFTLPLAKKPKVPFTSLAKRREGFS